MSTSGSKRNLAGKGDAEALVARVRERYGKIAEGGAASCCTPGPASCCGTATAVSREIGYAAGDLAEVPPEADLGLGCGAPLQHLELSPGETVLDLGSGPGLDALLAARAVGDSGHVIGVDMTPAMIERARATARKAGATQVEFRQGRLEELPVDDASVDAVTSNCVINLVPDKRAVFRELARVLRPGGRMVVSDIVLDGPLPETLAKDILSYVGCVAGAAPRREYLALVEASGLGEIEVLSDVDYLAGLAAAAPEEAASLLERTGTPRQAVEGKVRSITLRARKPR